MIEGRRKSTQIMYTALKKLLCDGRETKKVDEWLVLKKLSKNKSETNLGLEEKFNSDASGYSLF